MLLFQLPSNLELEDSCDLIPSYLDTSTPLDKNSRCSSGLCRSTDNKCGCTSTDHCPSNKVCKTSTNECETQQYKLTFNCDLGVSNEGTGSRVSLNVIRGGSTMSIESMDKTNNCPDHTFVVDDGQEPDQYEIRIHGSDALGVDYFTLYDATNGGEKIRRWGAVDGGGWCFSTDGQEGCWSVSGAEFPNRGVKLYKNGSSSARIRFGSGTRCIKDGACSSLNCKYGGGSCGRTRKCCA